MKTCLLTSAFIIGFFAGFAQPPQAFKYQAVVRDNTGEILQNQNIGVQISIHDFTTSTIVYQETFTETTNDFGLVNLEIGNGTPTIGIFEGIDWGNDTKFLEIEIDPNGGSAYVSVGTSELFAVPYAKVADVSRDAVWEKSGNDIYSSNLGKVGIGTASPDGRLEIVSPNGSIVNPSEIKGLVIKDGLYNTGSDFEITSFSGNSKFRILDNGYTIVGTDSKGIQMRTDGSGTDIESLGYDLAINYQSGNNTLLNVTSGSVGIGTSSPGAKLEVNSNYLYAIYGVSQNSTAIWGSSDNNIGVYGESASGTGVYGTTGNPNGFAGYFIGKLHVTGTLSKGAGSFLIDHPLDPENKLLRHNFVESPENLLIYRGKIQLDESGEAMVKMPEYFNALTMESEATIQLTPIGKSLHAERYEFSYEWLTSYDSFRIYGEPGRQISWMVLAERDDPVIHELARPVEEDKDDKNILCKKGQLLYPKAYGYPESMGRDYKIKQITNKNHTK